MGVEINDKGERFLYFEVNVSPPPLPFLCNPKGTRITTRRDKRWVRIVVGEKELYKDGALIKSIHQEYGIKCLSLPPYTHTRDFLNEKVDGQQGK